MAICGNCGANASRIRITFTGDGKPLKTPKEECSECCPELSAGTRLNDHKIWLMQDVNPNEYEMRDGQKHLKDWASAELRERIAAPDQDDVAAEKEAKERKRQHARACRFRTLTKSDIESTERLLRDQVTREKALNAGLALPI